MTRRAFTLVEMVVAIGIIVVLAVLTVTATVAIVEKSEVRRTEDVIRLLDMGIQEWESAADRKLSWGHGDPPDGATFDMDNSTPHVFTVTEVMRVIARSAAAKPLLAQIAPDHTYTYSENEPIPAWLPANPDSGFDPDPYIQQGGNPRDVLDDFIGEVAILDAWDNPLRIVHPGRRFIGAGPCNDNGDPDPDGTVFVDDEDHDCEGVKFYGTELIYGRARNRQVLIVSAGPDGRFGDLSTAATEDKHGYAHDNIYSYAVEDDHEQP